MAVQKRTRQVTKVWRKLVRDRIPEYLKKRGITVRSRQLSKQSFEKLLLAKLSEEASEVKKNPTAEELADVLEIVYAIGEKMGVKSSELERLRIKKARERGGFKKGVFLVWTKERKR